MSESRGGRPAGSHARVDGQIADFVWVGADRMADDVAAWRMGVTVRTVQRWRARMRELAGAGRLAAVIEGGEAA